MTEFSRIEIYNSYLFLRRLLGLTNKEKDDSFLIGIRYSGNQILVLNENSTKVILLLEKGIATNRWHFCSNYPELEPLALHIQKAINKSRKKLPSEPAFEALKEIINYDV